MRSKVFVGDIVQGSSLQLYRTNGNFEEGEFKGVLDQDVLMRTSILSFNVQSSMRLS